MPLSNMEFPWTLDKENRVSLKIRGGRKCGSEMTTGKKDIKNRSCLLIQRH